MPTTEIASPATVKEVDAETVRSWASEGRAVIVDVREPDEYAREHLDGAIPNPLSRFDATAVPSDPETKVVLHCQSGRRSLEAGARLLPSRAGDVYSMAGGLAAWRDAGFETVVDRRMPISIMRQVQLVIGSAVLLGSILAVAVSPWFLVLTGFFGAGLVVAGATGTCGLAAVIARLPWNRPFRCQDGACG